MRLHPPSLILGVLWGAACAVLAAWMWPPSAPVAAPPAALVPPALVPPALAPAGAPPGAGAPDPTELRLLLTLAGAPDRRRVELVLDRGRFEDGAWISEPIGDDQLLDPAAPLTRGAGTLARATAQLPYGDSVVTVLRDGCGRVQVPVYTGALDTVVVPYPACIPARPVDPVPAAWVAGLHELGLWPQIPDQGGGPLVWITHAEAAALCAWSGGGLPSRPGPTPPANLPAEWLADGTALVWTGATSRVDPSVPPNARTGSIGLRCADEGDSSNR